ncbi:Universal stress protein A family protein [Vanrija pseudolonga]|uniref:Universal stress protein A family protein n=1 Tax=Vanrija pseudolonga TaxID=143232 RepID=A0AAF0YEB7_9TREE|nr:Universal stress protein A family protein [Vanrija pseudolonga]
MTLRPAIKTVSSATSIPGLAMSREASLTSPTHHTGSAAATLLASPRPSVSTASGTSTGAGFPRTNTINSTVGENKYRRKVGFEAFDTGADTLFTFTCQTKSEGYKRSRNTRVFLVAVSPDESGEDALDWLMSELVEDGDEVVAMRVVEMGEEERQTNPAHQELREDAQDLLARVLHKNDEEDGRKISVIVEVVVGHVPDMILKMIALYRPDSLIVGTKGQRSRLQNWGKRLGAPGMGSISRFAVSHSPIPVVVVRPERKVKKTMKRREDKGKRGQYAALVGPDDNMLSRSRSRERSRERSRGRSSERGGISD